MSRACDRCGHAPEQSFLKQFSLVYSDGTMVTARFCTPCYAWAFETIRAFWGAVGEHGKTAA